MAATTSKKSASATEDLSNVEFETSEEVEVVPTFQSMKLREELLRGIYAYGKIYIKTQTQVLTCNINLLLFFIYCRI